jgi:hypothetical protein
VRLGGRFFDKFPEQIWRQPDCRHGRLRRQLVPNGPSPRELAELDDLDAWNKTVRLRAIETKISRELRSQYKLPKELPHRIFTLLMQLDAEQNGPRAEKGGA